MECEDYYDEDDYGEDDYDEDEYDEDDYETMGIKIKQLTGFDFTNDFINHCEHMMYEERLEYSLENAYYDINSTTNIYETLCHFDNMREFLNTIGIKDNPSFSFIYKKIAMIELLYKQNYQNFIYTTVFRFLGELIIKIIYGEIQMKDFNGEYWMFYYDKN